MHDQSSLGFGSRSARRGRSSSLSADYKKRPKPSVLSPPLVNPQPQYVAASAARQLIDADQGSNAFAKHHHDSVDITDAALALLNGFLDNILFSILLTAKSTRLASIRPAVADVLKPRLAREVVSAADDELGEYLGGGEHEELSEFHGGQEPSGHFELERSWKLIRLRCMVYSRLGDMEEEDEEDHLRREGLDDSGTRPGRFSNYVGHITPAAAIFLTSILEYIGENALIIITDNARGRQGTAAVKSSQGQPEEAAIRRPLVIDDMDVEKIALNPTLGRLWRTWRKYSRRPALSRTLSRESLLRSPRKTSSRQSSVGTVETLDEPQLRTFFSQPPVSEDGESVEPAEIPLPLSDNDIDEIEIPGFTAQLAVAVQARAFRPRSLFLTNTVLTAPTAQEHILPKSASALDYRSHSRSYSLPTTPLKTTRPPVNSKPDLVVVPPRKEQESLEPMRENAEHINMNRTRRFDTVESGSRANQHGSMDPDPFLDAPENTGSPVSSLHSDSIGVAISHSQISELPSPISRNESRFSKGSSEYEDYEPHTTLTSPSTKHSEMHERHQIDEEPVMTGSVQRLAVDDYTDAPSPIPERSPLRLSGQDLPPPTQANDTIVETAFVAQPTASASNPPRLSPLRELVAAATGTPDEHSPGLRAGPQSNDSSASKSASGQSNRSTSSRPKRPVVKTSMVTSAPHAMTNSPRSISPGRERAAVQRVSPPPSKSPSEPGGFRSRRSESNSSFPERRPITSGSGTSQVSSKLKGLVNRQVTPNPLRSAGDVNGDGTSDLDLLIESDETLHYTLTPRTMREIEDPGSPRWASVRTDNNNNFGDPDDSGSAAASESVSQGSVNSPPIGGGSNGLRIATPTRLQPKRPVPQARDARTEVKSVREFADFIRHTGPDPNAPKLHIPIVIPDSVRQNKLSHDFGTQASSPSPVPSRAQSSMSSHFSSPNRRRLEARSAATPKDNQTSDLIDFIREGPPRSGAHRIPRTVAPFRTTMDSDEFQSLSPTRLDRDALTRSSLASTQDSFNAPRSVNSSYNSRTGLLEPVNHGSGRAVRAQSQLGSVLDSPVDEVVEPVRTRRRVRDPYAIDTDSEDEVFAQSKKPQQKEESLMDFLRSVPPPPSNDELPQLLSVNMHAANETKGSKSKSKATMKSRLMRTASTDKAPTAKLSRSSLRSHKSFATPTSTPADAPALPPIHGALSSPQYPVRHESYALNSAAHPAQVERLRNGYNMSPRPTGELRKHTRADESDTSALADFFRNTGPPESPQPSRPPTSSVKESSGFSSFSRVFLRKKKQPI
ncbi:predicted protein [Uncinocarpus reesii 1704]|uniref:Uncharacterized protein n=1 Tax=Uncinocarpus reesii (strain UAMH 1704) TaxID=336963 RepID=C4JRS4_UNCRE|nr:uncharacterized protein UREG_05163 [Uncinocarpus reesii 1704]EEP80321.1 predicted protein [Uncinocarpus reesii 1704]